MKITYTMLTGDRVVRSIDGTSAVRRAVKTTVKNLKGWCNSLRRGKAIRVDSRSDWQNHQDRSEISCGRMTPGMIIDDEESRNRTNENLENELKEDLANNRTSVKYDLFSDDYGYVFIW